VKSVQTLIALAREKCHSDADLARRIGTRPPILNGMRHGTRPISPETVAALCDLLELSGEECREWVAVSIIENPKNSDRASMLRRALFACWALGVAALMTPNDAKAKNAGYMGRGNNLYIVAHRLRYALRRTARLCRAALRVASFGAIRRPSAADQADFGNKAVPVFTSRVSPCSPHQVQAATRALRAT